jgi:hypothetical protein
MAQLQWMLANEDRYRGMRLQCRRHYEANFTADAKLPIANEYLRQSCPQRSLGTFGPT